MSVCVVISARYACFCLFLISCHGSAVLLHAVMVPNSVSVFILSSYIPWCIMTPAFGLPCPVLLCPRSVSLSLKVSFSPLSLCRGIPSELFPPCWSGDTDRGERRKGRQECQTESPVDTLGLFHHRFWFCCLFGPAFWWLTVKDGRA